MKRWFICLLFGAFILSSCNKTNQSRVISPPSGNESNLQIGLSMKNAPSNVSSIVAILSRQGYDTLRSGFEILSDSAICSFTSVPVGTWHLQVNAFNSSNVMTYTGSTDVSVEPGITTPVRLTLNPSTGSISITVTWGGEDTSSVDMALEFNGNAGYVQLPDASVLKSQTLTVECSVLFDTLTDYIPILAQTNSDLWNQADGYGIVYDHGHLVFRMAETPDLAFYAWTAYTPPLHQWVHLAFTYDRNYKCIYINGTQVLKSADTTSIYYGDDGMSIGTAYVSDQGGRLYFKGGIDELRIWNYALSQDEIEPSMNTELTGKESGLIGYWNFDQNSSDTEALDRTGNGNNGLLFGGVKFVPASSLQLVNGLTDIHRRR